MVGLIVGIGCSVVLAAIVATFWVRGIDYMKTILIIRVKTYLMKMMKSTQIE